MNFPKSPILSLIALTLSSTPAFAAIDITSDLTLSGFGSTSITKSDNKTPLFINREITDETCYDCDTIFGIQLDYDVTDNLAASLQWVKRPQDEWSEPEVEWAYLSYDIGDFTVRAGRLRLPLFLASQYYYVAEAYYWARPPQEVYDSISGITYYDGGDITWKRDLSDELTLSVNPFYGSNRTYSIEVVGNELKFDTELLIGLSTDLSGYDYRLHYTYMRTKYTAQQFPFSTSTINIHAFGYEYSWKQFQFMAEVETDELQTNWYVSTAYNIDDFTTYITYSQAHHSNPSQSVTPGVRYDITPTWSVNLEYQYEAIDSDYIYATGLFVQPPILYSEKKDANLVTFMVNFIF
ncbi:porin [uncultured Shewanella sp.]|uniref:porin n=1 Tax=uncultured Shewanella sp. TaxID=173975 RepID=UPI00260D724B|nr:porin [uncultured Shewanella sp.]